MRKPNNNTSIIKSICLSILMGSLFVACETTSDDCIDESLINPDAIVTMEYFPVCGCNDITYSNPSIAEANGVTSWVNGSCETSTACDDGVPATVFMNGDIPMLQMEDGTIYNPVETPGGFVLLPGQIISIEYVALPEYIYPTQIEITCIEQTGETDCTPLTAGTYDDDFLPNDDISINSATIEDDCLFISVTHSGGCEDHEYELVELPLFCGTPPLPPTALQLRHDSNDDFCEALITKVISYDLSSLQIEGENSIDISLTINGDTDYNENMTYLYE